MSEPVQLVVKVPRPERKFPVAEVFGPTIQGEGPDAGTAVYFVRFGGCDYECSWCDSLHAVKPEFVRRLPRLTAKDIADKLRELGMRRFDTVVLSGGNPALHQLDDFVDAARSSGWRVTVETQGTRWKNWIARTNLVVVSPKPPSSGMVTDWDELEAFLGKARDTRVALKVVVGDDADYAYAREVHLRYPMILFFVSVLNPAGSDEGKFDIDQILAGYRGLCERVMRDDTMRGVVVLPQLHTLAWGAAKGV